ncbi:MAG: galactose-1-phosphate uridylyltransferase [Oceanidesulfovibrio sp.]
MSREGGEYREDPLTGGWVILAPERGSRPSDFPQSRSDRRTLPTHDENCPFCPGNEGSLTPIHDELAAIAAGAHQGPGQGAAWQVRAVANKYPAVRPRTGAVLEKEGDGPGRCMDGHGFHEVIVEHPRHDMMFQDMGAGEAEAAARMWRRRYVDLLAREGVESVVLFRNHGPGAGTSLLHPHSQIVATAVVPPLSERHRAAAQKHYEAQGVCLLCDYLRREERTGERVVFATDHFLVAAPYAPDGRCELLILPRGHAPDIVSLTEEQSADLARVLVRMYGVLDSALTDPDSNLVFHTAPRRHRKEPFSHWYARLRPRMGTPAGFELGSGVSIASSLPEEDAAELRTHVPTP